MTRLLFEDVPLLAGILAFLQFPLLVRWARRRDRGSVRAVVAGAVCGTALLAVSLVVVTWREELIRLCGDLARAVDEGDLAAIDGALSEDFRVGGLDRAAFLARLKDTLSRYRIDRPRLRRFDLRTPDPRSAVVAVTALAQVRSAEHTWNGLPTRWRLTFHRAGPSWKLADIESLPVPPLNLRRLEEWLR